MASRYSELLQLALDSRERTRSGPVVIKGSSLPWEESHHGRVAYISEPVLLGSNVQTMSMFLEELEPGGHNGRHRHFNEALVHILDGRGYSVVDGVRHDWETGDTIAVPQMSWHQHFNADMERPARFLGCVNDPLLRAMGLFRMEDSDEPEGQGSHKAAAEAHG